MSKKQKLILKIVVPILSALLLFVLFFPMKLYFKDGGTVMYAGFFGATYSVSKLHKLTPVPDGGICYRVGTVVEIFGITVYDDSYIDYEFRMEVSDDVANQVEDIFREKINSEIDSYIDSYNDSIKESDIDYDNPVKIDDIAETDPSV